MMKKRYKLIKSSLKEHYVSNTLITDLEHLTDHELLIKNVRKDFKGPYTVCFYYYDLNKKDVDLYKKVGMSMVVLEVKQINFLY